MTATPGSAELIAGIAQMLEGHTFGFVQGNHHKEVATRIVDEALRRLAAKPAEDGARKAIARALYDLNPSWSSTQFNEQKPTDWSYNTHQKQLALRQADAILSLPVQPGAGERALESCKGEQLKFEEWATAQRYDMTEHPLHYLFLDAKTYAARQGWKAALEYARNALSRQAPHSSSEEVGK